MKKSMQILFRGFNIKRIIFGSIVLLIVCLSFSCSDMLSNYLVGKYTIIASAEGGGSISPQGDVAVKENRSQMFIIAPSACAEISDVVVDGVSQGAISSYTFDDITKNHTITAVFSVIIYTVSALAGSGGTITHSGMQEVDCGDSMSFTITPDNIHSIVDVTVNGESVGPVSTLNFDCIHEDLLINATFNENTIIEYFPGDGVVKSWQAPANIYNNIISIIMVGGGGGGGGAYRFSNDDPYHYNAGQGGGAGKYKEFTIEVAGGGIYSVMAGVGGAGGVNRNPSDPANAAQGGDNGQRSYFKNDNLGINLTAAGGTGGNAANSSINYENENNDHRGEISGWPGYGNGGHGGVHRGVGPYPSAGREGRIAIIYTLVN